MNSKSYPTPRATLCVPLCVALGAFLQLASPASGANWYVRPGGAGVQNGKSWETAVATVAAGIAKAYTGDAVLVAEGHYHERITVPHGVAVRGGYREGAGGIWSRVMYSSRLDGDNLGPTVVFLSGGTEAEISGFILENGIGQADGKLRRGGAVYAKDAQVFIAYNWITNNKADLGGGVYLAGCTARVHLNRFELNTANSGAGLYAGGGQVTLSGNQFRFDTAKVRGAGVTLSNTESAQVLSNVFRENRSFGSAPAIHVTGAGNIANNTVVANVGWGGAVEVASPSATVFANNLVAFNDSGGILVENAATAPTVRFNDVYHNTAFGYSGIPDPTGTNGNISVEPITVSAYDLRPRTYSPLVDAGRDLDHAVWDYDADGASRIRGACIDIGAYEANTPKAKPPVCVKPAGNDANDGSTWTLAMRTVQAAVNRAAVLDREVWVAAGTYKGRVTLRDKNVAVYGGFDGTEKARFQRDPAANRTILSGDGLTAAVVVFESVAGTVDRTAVLDGFTISGMTVDETSMLPEVLGGGIRILDASPTITNNVVSGNLIRNQNGGQGGGIYIHDGAPLIARNTIRDNVAGDAGGLYAWNCDGEIAFNLISRNMARELATDPAGDPANGGGLYVVQGHAVLERNHVFKNEAEQGGGFKGSGDELTLFGNVFEGNSARYGGGVYLGLNTLFHSNLLIGNGASVRGGGIEGYIGETRIINNTVADNTAPHGGAVALNSSDARLANNIFAFNSSGVYRMGAGAPVLDSNDVFANSGGNYEGIAAGASDFSNDPLFVDRPRDYRLRQYSLLFERGDNSWISVLWLDADGEERRQGGNVDTGAYENATWNVPTWRDVATALRMIGGLEAANTHAYLNLDTDDHYGLTLPDAAGLARQAVGLDDWP